jgi:hypothetical protein
MGYGNVNLERIAEKNKINKDRSASRKSSNCSKTGEQVPWR